MANRTMGQELVRKLGRWNDIDFTNDLDGLAFITVNSDDHRIKGPQRLIHLIEGAEWAFSGSYRLTGKVTYDNGTFRSVDYDVTPLESYGFPDHLVSNDHVREVVESSNKPINFVVGSENPLTSLWVPSDLGCAFVKGSWDHDRNPTPATFFAFFPTVPINLGYNAGLQREQLVPR